MTLSQDDALGLAARVASKEVSPTELVEDAIARIEKVNPQLNAVVHPLYVQARARAQTPLEGPFAGVPFLLKDLGQTIAGAPTVGGSRFFRGEIASEDSELFGRYQAAGLITLGKTNTPELGLMPVTEPEVFGPTRNPWDTSRTCGGSSGGAAAAVASGMVPMAHGGDGGGSIRIPSACAGIFGLKPTRGRTPAGPMSEHWSGFAIEHVLSISVRDSAAALDAVEGVEPYAPYHPPHKEGSYLGEVSRDPGRLRVAFTTDPAMPSDVHPDCVAAVADAAKLLEDLGHEVNEVSPRWNSSELASAFFTVVSSNVAAEIREAEIRLGKKAKSTDFETSTWLAAMMGRIFTGAEVVTAQRALQTETRRLVRVFGGYDVLLTPTLGQPPLAVGAMKAPRAEARLQELIARTGFKAPLRLGPVLEQTINRVYQWIPFTPVANFTGQPSMNVPLHWNAEGLPIGTMFTGRFGDEATLFRLAAQLEQARPWRDRRPTVHAAS